MSLEAISEVSNEPPSITLIKTDVKNEPRNNENLLKKMASEKVKISNSLLDQDDSEEEEEEEDIQNDLQK